jgi:hypothetical protein
MLTSHQQAGLLESRVSVNLAATGTQAIQPAIRVSADSKVEHFVLDNKRIKKSHPFSI